MTEEEIDQAMRARFRVMIAKCKTEQEKGKCIDDAIDWYFEMLALHPEAKQLELFKGGDKCY